MVDVACDPDRVPKMVGGGEVVMISMIRMILMIVIPLSSLKNPVGKRVIATNVMLSNNPFVLNPFK